MKVDEDVIAGGLILLIGFAACRAGSVDISPYVEADSRFKNTDGAGARVGVMFSPAPEKESPHREERVTDPIEDEATAPPEDQEITVETPFGPVSISLGSGVIALLAMFMGQKLGWIPVPTRKEKIEA